ncbi:hypothetical protein DEU56DRAFT_734638, partial [Suillus clintonianus]|uniref:uncharacterized protein n=1 Tax=Suillus clintonianus TaxID=1904413 RepID=UPI001B8739FA
EIDTILGSSRLQCFEDRPSLLYVEAILSPILPLGMHHHINTCFVYSVHSGI